MNKTLLFGLIFLTSSVFAQTGTSKAVSYKIGKAAEVKMRNKTDNEVWIRMNSLETPDALSKQAYLDSIKKVGNELYPKKYTGVAAANKTTALSPIVLDGFNTHDIHPFTGAAVELISGIPNDNTLALSNDGLVLTSSNTFIWGWDTKNDTMLFLEGKINLRNVVDFIPGTPHCFDPKLHYDPVNDRFILIFLINNQPTSSKIAVAFSQTNNPNDGWNVYLLPGNPLNNNRWTDFPAFSISEHSLYLTVNLIIPDVSWQVGFDGSIIWQMDLNQGYAGEDSVSSIFHHDIKFGNRFIRNLHPVCGAEGVIDTAYFLSNRNFDVENDSIFVLRLPSRIEETPNLDIRVRQSNLRYGVPPNGAQTGVPIGNTTKGLQTNDARVLGAIRMPDGKIQFVSTTREFNDGKAAIYHGVIQDPGSSAIIKARVITDSVRDYGYPNIAFSGNENCDQEVIIGFNHTSRSDYAGVSAIYCNNDTAYSDVITLKVGDNYVNRLGGTERWGDYFGIQRHYPSQQVWTAGFYGTQSKQNSTWVSLLQSPDSTQIIGDVVLSPGTSSCDHVIDAQFQGGVPPYTYLWNGTSGGASYTACVNDTVNFTVSDSRGCTVNKTIVIGIENLPSPTVYPNPFREQLETVITLPGSGPVRVVLSDMSGADTYDQMIGNFNAGKQLLQFYFAEIRSGMYVLRVYQNDELVHTEKIIRQ